MAPGLLALIDAALADQADLSAVERFADRHDAGLIAGSGRWRDLLPAAPPGPGQQYAFEVDLDSCTGCKACVTACRSLNGLDEDESWRTVGLLQGGSGGQSLIQNVTAACHHCLNPACLNGCPVDAYEKDPVTGIVRHLDDQCIGCSYCTFTCPYDVPRYNPARGIVRKCDMCAGRLQEGEPPACVQACPNAAITIAVVDKVEAVARAVAEGALVPGAAPSGLTIPATRYHSRRGLPGDLAPAGRFASRPSHHHPPLAFMLVLTQLSVGAFAADLVLRATAPGPVAGTLRPANAAVALVLGLLALGASVLHLGRPAYAWRAVIGLRHSWLSREIVAFSAFAGLAVAYAGALAADAATPGWRDLLGLLVAGSGAVGVACSVMVYGVTGRAWWSARRTGVRFVLTAVVCGLATSLAVALVTAAVRGRTETGVVAGDVGVPLALGLAAAVGAKLAWEARLAASGHRAGSDIADSTRLLTGPALAALVRWRFGLGFAGGVLVPLVLAGLAAADDPSAPACAVLATVTALATAAGELCERTAFFKAVTSPGMPRDLP
jgi:Fe-S-cluster-containing dehydrogenase component/DMSO reductase anchor subunit